MTTLTYDAARDMTRLIQQIAAGDVQVIAQFFDLRPERRARALWLFRRDRVDAPWYDAEDALQDTWLKLSRDARAGKLDGLQTLTELHQLICSVMRSTIRCAGRHFATRKEGGQIQRSVLEDLDQLFSPEPPAEAAILGDDLVAWFLGLLDEPILRDITRGRLEGATNEVLARDLGISVRSVGRKLQRIRKILRRNWPEARNEDDGTMAESP